MQWLPGEFTVWSSQHLMLGCWSVLEREKTHSCESVPLQLRSVLLKAWEPFLWNVIIKNRVSVSQSLWEGRILTWKLPASRHCWSNHNDTDRCFVIFHLSDSNESSSPCSLILPLKPLITSAKIRMELSPFPYCQWFPNNMCFHCFN